MGKSDPYLEFSRQMPDGKLQVVHRTEVHTALFLYVNVITHALFYLCWYFLHYSILSCYLLW